MLSSKTWWSCYCPNVCLLWPLVVTQDALLSHLNVLSSRLSRFVRLGWDFLFDQVQVYCCIHLLFMGVLFLCYLDSWVQQWAQTCVTTQFFRNKITIFAIIFMTLVKGMGIKIFKSSRILWRMFVTVVRGMGIKWQTRSKNLMNFNFASDDLLTKAENSTQEFLLHGPLS